MAPQQTVVIVVDDNAGFLKSVARLLAHNGIETRTFASAEALIESGSAQWRGKAQDVLVPSK